MNSLKHKILIIAGIIVGACVVFKLLMSLSTNTGQQSYELYCSKCHGKDGEGFKELVPPFTNSEWLSENYTQIPCVIRNGIKDRIVSGGKIYQEEMLGIPQLNEIQIANISNYILQEFSNQKHFFTEQEVKDVLDSCEK